MKLARRAVALNQSRPSSLSTFSTAFMAVALGAMISLSAAPAMAAGSSAQSGAGAAAADTAAAEAAPQKAAPPKPAAAKPDAGKAAEGKAAEGKAAAAPAPRQVMPEPKALPPNLSGECAWTGKRIVSLLARDDVDQAKRFLEFYRLFACKEAHIAPTFRCVIASEQADNPSEEFADRVDRCWEEIE